MDECEPLKRGDLMRLSISSPGNDFRLGAMEAGAYTRPLLSST